MMWWLPLVLAVPGFFLWTMVHEGAHAIAIWATGGKVTSFKPWPHKADSGKWYFGRVGFDGGKLTPRCIAPFVADVVAFGALVYPALVADSWAWWVVMTAMALPAVNTGTGVLGRFRRVRHTDLSAVEWWWAVPFFALLLVYVVTVAGLLVWKLA